MTKLAKILGVALIATGLMVSVTGCADPNSGLDELRTENEQLKNELETEKNKNKELQESVMVTYIVSFCSSNGGLGFEDDIQLVSSENRYYSYNDSEKQGTLTCLKKDIPNKNWFTYRWRYSYEVRNVEIINDLTKEHPEIMIDVLAIDD